MAKVYRSKIAAAVHESMSDLHHSGVVDKQTMKKFDEMCLTPVRDISPDHISM
jgi:putative transcriptional regulator